MPMMLCDYSAPVMREIITPRIYRYEVERTLNKNRATNSHPWLENAREMMRMLTGEIEIPDMGSCSDCYIARRQKAAYKRQKAEQLRTQRLQAKKERKRVES